MHFRLGVRNSGTTGLPIPSRSSFLLALGRERGERQSLRIIRPLAFPRLGAEALRPPAATACLNLPPVLGEKNHWTW